jgi:hypothetical protein
MKFTGEFRRTQFALKQLSIFQLQGLCRLRRASPTEALAKVGFGE